MTEWCYAVVDSGKLPFETVETAMNILDRFLLSTCQSTLPLPSGLSRETISFNPKLNSIFRSCTKFKLITVTCLYIASKSTAPNSLTPLVLESLSKKEIAAREIEMMEMKILSVVKFQIDPPTIISFAQQMQYELKIWNCDSDGVKDTTHELQQMLFLELVEQQARLATRKLYPFHVSLSSIALACVKNALLVMQAQSLLPADFDSMSSSSFQKAWRKLEKQIRASCNMRQKQFSAVQDRLQTKLRSITRQTAFEWKRNNLEDDNNSINLDDAWSTSTRLSSRSLTTIEEVGK
eukprot:CAMPEP_0113620236 /NCGR_PEP_ID=MMETSP0017_2-20120614/10304_1 /TAXON_ID=2856 /ORGANISM="Cylindrotheca closterium" /LENGTH=292 /DNA_ID=CAMNT_0000529881 /DNA_START=310 /DNA_END=1188 /DNA_ORIENTATION=- /assembly_acc=CAM_ASM_000147